MTQSGYSFTPGKYDPVKQTDVVPEQEKSNARILESEERFLDEMNARDDALVEKTRSEWESLSNLSSSFAGWMEKKAEKDKKEKMQKGSYLALISPASAETIQALTDKENGLLDSHLKISEIADRIEETTGSYELAQQFRNLSGWEQYSYVKASLIKAAGGYSDFKNEAKATTFIKGPNGEQIGYDSVPPPNAAQLAELNAKVRFDFSAQFIGVNEELLSATVGPEILKIDNADDEEAKQNRDTLAKDNDKKLELTKITSLFVDDPSQSRFNVDAWITENKTHYGGLRGSRLAFRQNVRDLVASGKLDLVKAQAMVEHLTFHSGNKKDENLEVFQEFKGFGDDLIEANAEWQKKRLDVDKATVASKAESLRNELDSQNTQLSVEQKRDYLKRRWEEYPDVPLNADEQFILYGYKDDETMRGILKQKATTFGGITEKDLEFASPTIRDEFKGDLIPDAQQQLISLNSLPDKELEFVTDLVRRGSKNTGALDAKSLNYWALMAETEKEFVMAYNTELAISQNPEFALAKAKDAIVTKFEDTEWIDDNSQYKMSDNNEEYKRKMVVAQAQVKPETKGYATVLLEAPKEQKEALQDWAAAGGKGPVPYYYQNLANNNNILPRELAWRQAKIMGYEGQFSESDIIKEFNIPLYMIKQFCNKSTECKWSRFKHEVEVIDKKNNDQFNEEEVDFYEENEDID
jgi:hypothetical protein